MIGNGEDEARQWLVDHVWQSAEISQANRGLVVGGKRTEPTNGVQTTT